MPKITIVPLLLAVLLGSVLCFVLLVAVRPRRTQGYRWSDIPLEEAFETLSAAAPAPLHLTPTDGQAAKVSSDTRDILIMRFSVPQSDVFGIATAFQMEESSIPGAGAITGIYGDPTSIYPSYSNGRKYVPAWFAAWEGSNIVASGTVSGMRYRLVFLAVPEDENRVMVFLRHDTGRRSSPRHARFSAEFDEPIRNE